MSSLYLRKSDKAWLAGIVDGEGCLVFNNQGSGYHLIRVCITNSDEGILDEVKRILKEWKVTYSVITQKKQSEANKQCYVVEISRQLEAGWLLKQLLPYLKSAKRYKAFMAIDALKRKDSLGRTRNTIKGLKRFRGMAI